MKLIRVSDTGFQRSHITKGQSRHNMTDLPLFFNKNGEEITELTGCFCFLEFERFGVLPEQLELSNRNIAIIKNTESFPVYFNNCYSEFSHGKLYYHEILPLGIQKGIRHFVEMPICDAYEYVASQMIQHSEHWAIPNECVITTEITPDYTFSVGTYEQLDNIGILYAQYNTYMV